PATSAPRASRSARWWFHRAARQPGRPANSLARVPLFPPWTSIVVVSVPFPEPRFVVIQQRDAAYPLGALPEAQMRAEQARGPTVLGRQFGAVIPERDPGLLVHQIAKRQVWRIAAVGATN